MEENIATSDLLRLMARKEGLTDAIIEPVSNLDIASSTLGQFGVGAVNNVNSLVSNIADLSLNGKDSNVAKLFSKIDKKKNPEFFDNAWELAKVPFAEPDNESSIVDSLFGKNTMSGAVKETQDINKKNKAKNKLADTVGLAQGNAGEFIGEAVAALPIARFGTMSSTRNALVNGDSKIDVAKAITKDAIANSATVGASEFALGKFYGKDDAQAASDAIVAGIIGGVGTPLVGAGLLFGRKIGKTIDEGEELMAQQAGGGKPPETKSGREIDSEEVQASKEAIESVEFDVSSPIAERPEIKGNEYVPETNNPAKFKYGYDERGRVYTEESSYLNPQGTSEQKASLKIRERENVTNAKEEVDRRLEFYDRDTKLQEAYGQSQAKFKGKKELSGDVKARNRQSFEKEQYRDIARNKNLTNGVKKEARRQLKELNQKKIIKREVSEAVKKTAERKFKAQSKVNEPIDSQSRDAKLRQEFKTFVANSGNKKGYSRKATNTSAETITTVVKKARGLKANAVKSINSIKDKEALAGKSDFKESKITPEIRRSYPDEVADIEAYTARQQDIKLYQKDELSMAEFRFREKRRIDDEIKRESGTIKEEDIPQFAKDISSRYQGIGIYETPERIIKNLKVKGEFKSKGGVENPIKKAKREEEETDTATAIHNDLIDKLNRYKNMLKKHGDKARVPTNAKGRPSLSASQIVDIKDNILSMPEIANKTAPISTKSKRQDAIDKAREYASEKVNKRKAKDMGIKSRFKDPEQIIFKDVIKDASNSVAQIFSVLLGSKRLGRLSKLTGEDVDIRNVIGEQMSKLGVTKPKTINKETGKEMTWKDVVKPIFMTKNYGQQAEGLAKNFAKTHKMPYDEALHFIKTYDKALNIVAPDFKKLSDEIFELFNNSKSADFSWTMPDKFEVKFKLTKTEDGKLSIQGEDYRVKINTLDKDEFARALMPNLIHSVDGYIARKMNLKGYPSIHDAFIALAKNSGKLEKDYAKILQDINSSNLLDEMMASLGYKGKSLKVGDLTNKDIADSKFKLGTEHSPDKAEPLKFREFDMSRQGTHVEVMKDYMASGNYRQVKTSQMVESMVNESAYNNSFTKKAREGDDPFERQVALAMQSPKYNEKLAIPAPDGVNAKMFDKAQREIFNEARARLEYHPWLTEVIQGERKFFGKNQKRLNDTDKTVNELINEELRLHRKILKSKSRAQRKAVSGIKIEDIKNWSPNKVLTKNETLAKSYADEALFGNIKAPNQYKTLWNEQINPDSKLKQFNMFESMANVFKSEVQRSTEILYDRLSKIPKGKQDDIMKLVHSDYESIRGMKESMANQIWKDNKQLRDIAWREINQGAKGLKSTSEQFGAYLPNAGLIAKRYDLDESAAQVIDQLISIKAMKDNDGWNVLKKYGSDKDVDFVMDTMTQKRNLSQHQLFHDSPDKYTKGYVSEVYQGNKKIDKDGSVKYDADSKYEEGVLGSDRENNKVGTKYDGETPGFKTLKDELDWMMKNRLRKGHDGYRKVTGETIKTKAGKTNDLAEVLSETHRSTIQKIKERGIVHRAISELADDSLLFSKTPKKGMVELTEKQSMKLPYDLRTELKYIDLELRDKLLGRNEIRLYNGENQNYKIADRLLANLSTAFKQNVVLKNPVSYVNSLLVNQTLGLSAGMSPKELLKYQNEAIKDLSEMRFLLEKLTLAKVSGKKLDRELARRLVNNKLYKLERAGLSTNRVEGVVGDNDLLGSILEDHVSSPIFKMARVMNLNQKTTIGRASLKMFSNIDTMGRYALASKFISQGLSPREAAQKANGLFGDMDKMIPPALELLDSRGFVPFLKWYTVTTPTLIKLTKDNPKKALALGIATYVFAQETDTNLSTINPIEAAIDFAEGSLPFGTLENIEKRGLFDTIGNRAKSTVVPKYIVNAIRSPETLGANKFSKPRLGEPWSDDSVDYRGFTQQIIEGF